MRIENLFQKDISRPINGVVKADQLDESSVWQELEEFVVTKELDQHLRRFFSIYCEAMEKTGDPDVAGKIGVGFRVFLDPANPTSSKCCPTCSITRIMRMMAKPGRPSSSSI